MWTWLRSVKSLVQLCSCTDAFDTPFSFSLDTVLACQWALATRAIFSVIWSEKLQTDRQAVADGCGEKFIVLVYKLVKALSFFENYSKCSLEWDSFYVILLCSFMCLCRNNGN